MPIARRLRLSFHSFVLPALVLLTLGGCTAMSGPLSSHDGGGVHYLDTGAQPGATDNALVFVHGWASDHTVWRDQLEAMRTRGWRILAIDLPGHGDSEPVDGAHSMDVYADGIAAMMDDAGVKRAVLIGHSNGTPTIRQFYRRYPDRTIALVGVDGALSSVIDPAQMREFAQRFGDPGGREFAVSMLEQMVPETWTDADRELVMSMIDNATDEAMVGGIMAAGEDAIWELDPIEVPVLLLNAESPYWTGAYIEEVRSFVPDLEVHEFEGVTHFLMFDRPEGFNSKLTWFIKRRGLLDE